MEEIWKDIKGYEGLYQISNYGRIYSLKKGIIKRSSLNRGYVCIRLYKNGKGKPYSVHRLVAKHFIPNPNNYPCVNHKDENPSNNCVSNLEWCTYSYNNTYGSRLERCAKSMKDFKHTEESKKRISNTLKTNHFKKRVQCVTTGEVFNSVKEAGEYYSIKSYMHISKCLSGELKTCGKHPVTGEKLVWKYLDLLIKRG